MQASLTANYQQQTSQAQQLYYGHHPTSIVNDVSVRQDVTGCPVLSLSRGRIDVEAVQRQNDNDDDADGDVNEPDDTQEGMNANDGELGQMDPGALSELQDNALRPPMEDHENQGEKVQFLVSRLDGCDDSQVVYETSEQHRQEQYRYTAVTTPSSYQHLVNEHHYYAVGHNHSNDHNHNQLDDQTLDQNATSHENQPTFHNHEQQQMQEVLAINSNCQQAVDLSSDHHLHDHHHQLQQTHGPFESSPAIYYELSSASATDQSEINPSLDNYNEHLQQIQQRSTSFVYQQLPQEYQPVEFVSVLTEQNRFPSQQVESRDDLNVVESSQVCHPTQQYTYEAASVSRLSDATHSQYPLSSSAIYTNAFNFNKTHTHQSHSQVPPLLAANEPDSSYFQSLNLTTTNYNQQQPQTQAGAYRAFDIHIQQANNENYHHDHQNQQSNHVQEHNNDCHNTFHIAGQQANELRHQQFDYAAHLMGVPSEDSNASALVRDSHSCALSTVSESSSMTTNSDLESVDSALTRDEKKAREANIPLSYQEIVNLSIEQFNEHLSRYPYTEAQLTLMKDIRRRGKNKVAAQTCRKRKMEQITELQHEVGELANKRMVLTLERSRLCREHAELVDEYDRWCRAIQDYLQATGRQSQPLADDQNCIVTYCDSQVKLWPTTSLHVGENEVASQQQMPSC